MSDNSKIEWTDATWNPVTGCSVVSPGCTNCYAMRLAGTRLRHHPSRAGLTIDSKAGPVWNGKVRFNEEWIDQPLRWRRPRRIFVCAHGDLFHESVPDEWIDKVFAVMALAPQHKFQVLTKRASRMRAYIAKARREIANAAICFDRPGVVTATKAHILYMLDHWPLPNVWLGVSAEDQERADERIPDLLATPAAVRFFSLEPLLGPIDLEGYLDCATLHCDCGDTSMPVPVDGISYIAGKDGFAVPLCPACGSPCKAGGPPKLWIIAGGESGPGARPMHPDWARRVRDHCAAAGVPFFFKQWGEWHPCEMNDNGACYPMPGHGKFDSWKAPIFDQFAEAGWNWRRLGKKAAGALLDGREHRELPA